jgi:hypothetical protein
VAARLVLPYNKGEARRAARHPQYSYKPGAWKEVGFLPDMGSTGERQEIGLVTDATAEWLTGGSPNNMLVQAEAHASVPVHFRVDGKMVDITKFPKASCYYSKEAVHADPWFNKSGYAIRPEIAHYPNLNYVAYLATGDLYYLQELQDAATFALIWGNPEYRGYSKGLLWENQTRGYAWSLNLIASAYIATPENPPAPLLPKAYWKTIIDSNREDFTARWVKNGVRNPLTGCHFAVDLSKDHVAPWQQDFLGFVMGWMIWTGQFPDWRENYEWHARQAIDRASGKVGYPRSRAVQYYYKTSGVSDMASLARVNWLVETGNGQYPPKTDSSYAAYLRGNLKVATLNKVAGAADSFTYADSQSKKLNFIPMKWAV